VPRLGIGLKTPLFLRTGGPPGLADLTRSALGVVSDLFRMYGEELTADHRALRDSALLARRVDHCFAPFSQGRRSARSGRYEAEGVEGGGVWSGVPLSLVPWLVWGGRLGVGEHRVAGPGAWRVVLE
jgi:hypothetical protein